MARWQRNLYAAWLAQLLAMVGFSFVFPFMPLFVQDLGVGGHASIALWAGALTTSTALSMALAAPVWGHLADRYGRKIMVMRAMFAAALLVTAMGLVANVQQLLVLRILQGLFTGTVSASAAMVSAGTPRDRQGYALGLMQGAVFAGAAGGPVLGGVAASAFGLRSAFWAAGAALLLGGLVVALLVKEDFQRPAAGTNPSSLRSRLGASLPTGDLRLLLLIFLVLEAGGMVVNPILALYVADLDHLGHARAALHAGLIVGASALAAAVTAVYLGRRSDRAPLRLLVLCTAGAAASYLPQAFVTASWQLGLMRVLTGAFIGGAFPAANNLLAQRTPPGHLGAAYGMTSSAQSLGNAMGPLAGAFIAASFGIPAVFVAAAVAMAAVSTLGAWSLLRASAHGPRGAPGRRV